MNLCALPIPVSLRDNFLNMGTPPMDMASNNSTVACQRPLSSIVATPVHPSSRAGPGNVRPLLEAASYGTGITRNQLAQSCGEVRLLLLVEHPGQSLKVWTLVPVVRLYFHEFLLHFASLFSYHGGGFCDTPLLANTYPFKITEKIQY